MQSGNSNPSALGAVTDSVFLSGECIPVLIPLPSVHKGADARHSVDATDTPAGPCLFQSAADEILTGAFDLPAPDRTPLTQAIGVIQVVSVGLKGLSRS